VNDKQPDMAKLPPLTTEEISQHFQCLNGDLAKPNKASPVMVAGVLEPVLSASKVSSLAEPWIRDAKSHGPALQAAIDRYIKVYGDMGQERKMYTCIDKRQGAMTAAIELYFTLVAEQQPTNNAVAVEEQSAPANPGMKGLLVAVAYHNNLSKAHLDEADRLFLAYEQSNCDESRQLAKIAHDHALKHTMCANDMMRMAMGEKPDLINDPMGEFAKVMARLLS
jgi:hypothetical protein